MKKSLCSNNVKTAKQLQGYTLFSMNYMLFHLNHWYSLFGPRQLKD